MTKHCHQTYVAIFLNSKFIFHGDTNICQNPHLQYQPTVVGLKIGTNRPFSGQREGVASDVAAVGGARCQESSWIENAGFRVE